MKLTFTPLLVLLGLAAAGCRSEPGDSTKAKVADERRPDATLGIDDEGSRDTVLAPESIPQLVRDAAIAAVPGLVISEAEREQDDGVVIYCVHGTAAGRFHEVEVSADGKVKEIETGDEDDGDEDEDDEDEDEDEDDE